jgi:inosose dehydratase
MKFSRRLFIAGLGTAGAGAFGGLSNALVHRAAPSPFNGAGMLPESKILFGCAAITWNGNDLQAVNDISEVGFRGIQLRANVLKAYGDRPAALSDLLKQHHLEFVALSSGNVGIDPATENEEISRHVSNAKFLRDAGGRYLQLIDSARPKGRAPVSDDYKQLGRRMTEIGKRVADLGIPLGYHNHMNALGQSPEEVDRVMDAADPRYVKLELDTAHYQQGGGNPALAIKQYGSRILFLHLKDLESPVTNSTGAKRAAYHFCELGLGKVDLPAVFGALREINFSGWAVVELDGELSTTRTPKESALISKKYIEGKLGMKI